MVERSFADAFRIGTGDPVTVGGRSFRVVGIAVTAAMVALPVVVLHDPVRREEPGSPNAPLLIPAMLIQA